MCFVVFLSTCISIFPKHETFQENRETWSKVEERQKLHTLWLEGGAQLHNEELCNLKFSHS
jgi:hypothetical protein